ncbi:MAG: peroxidase-related enzyme [Gammaproteobacteria bacterium]|nr:peroxidase-related enzyme [Gammaproteobacteria bacterium]
MTRINVIDPEQATGRSKELLDKTQAQLGRVPNLYKAMASSPAALDGYLSFRGALVQGKLSASLREQIALLTAALNACEYCVSAHAFRGQKLGLRPEELALNQTAAASDPKIQAALNFVKKLVAKNGAVSTSEFDALKAAGWSDEEAGEMVAHVALNVFSNYFNHVAQPELDFPLTKLM